MQTIHRNPDERGSAILMVLGILSVVLILAMVFAVTSRNAQTVADAKADQSQAQLLAESAGTSVEQIISLFQNKGNLLKNSSLEDNLPEEVIIDQSMSTLGDAGKPDKFFYGTPGNADTTDFLGLQPYVGYVDATTDWFKLCLYGELASDAHANVPFGIVSDASNVRDVKPYQSLYYSHGDDDTYDEEGSEGANSLYQIIANTRLGSFYHEAAKDGATDHFEALLKNDRTKQLQFKNVKDNDGHITSRMGFLAFSEGSKFDVNQLVKPEMTGATDGDLYVPYVSDGEYTVGDPGNDVEQDEVGVSTYAIMGYEYDSDDNRIKGIKNDGELSETETIQYGLHPQELQTRINGTGDSIYQKYLKRADDANPPRWFNYDMLTEHSNSEVKGAFKKDIFTLGVASGSDDRELRFNGQYKNMDELLYDEEYGLQVVKDGEVQGNFLQKVDIAHPWGVYCDTDFNHYDDGCGNVTWEKISENIADQNTLDNFKSRTEYYFKKHLGLNYSPKDVTGEDDVITTHKNFLFADNGGNDVTPAVFANMVDFCDEDYAVTAFDADGDRIKFNDSTDYNVQPTTMAIAADKTIGEPTLCSNERVPSIVGVNVAMGLKNDGGNWLVTRRAQVKDANNINRYVYRIEVGSGSINFTPKVTLSMQNFFNEDLTKTNQKYRVIVQGKITPFLLAKKKYFDTQDHFSNVLVFLKGTTMTSSADTVPVADNADSQDYGLTAASVNTMIKEQVKANGLNFSIDKTTDKLDRDFAALQNQSVEIECDTLTVNIPNTLYTNDSYGLPTRMLSGQISHYLTGSGYAVVIDKIMVMVQNEENESDEICELMYAHNENPEISFNYVDFRETAPTSNIDQRSFWNPAKTSNTTAYYLVNCSPVDGATCKDPRLNYKSSQWTWYKHSAEKLVDPIFSTPFIAIEDNSSATTGYNRYVMQNCINNNVSGVLPWPHGKLAKLALTSVEDALKNSDRDVAKDWEPEFEPGDMAMTAAASDYCTGKMDTTLSTYFIPNYPFTSLWQLGAIHRGVEGQTINLKKFGTIDDDSSTDYGELTHKYEDGDAWLLDYFCLNELYEDRGIRGKFNPNCFNAPAYRFLFANIPANTDAKDTMIYANGFKDADDVDYNEYYTEFIDDSLSESTAALDLEEEVFRFKTTVGTSGDYEEVADIMAAQSWSPVQAFFNFVEVDGGDDTDVQCNDRQAESLIGCTAGIMSTRYETYTVIAVGQNLKWIMDNSDMPAGDDGIAFRKQIANPIQIGGGSGDWYSILSTEVRLVTLLRDCWFGKIKVLKSQVL